MLSSATWPPTAPGLARGFDGGHIVAFFHQGAATEVVALPATQSDGSGGEKVASFVVFSEVLRGFRDEQNGCFIRIKF